MRNKIRGFWILAALWLAVPASAHAQYKNAEFGLDAGYWMITKPNLLDKNGDILGSDQRPLRLHNGFRLGGESDFKMDQDHWWFVVRVNFAALQYAPSNSDNAVVQQYDQDAKDNLGTLLGIQGQMGVRYVVFTDRVRPYVQLSLSYLRLMTFTTAADSNCDMTVVCTGEEGTVASYYLPHPNVGGIHMQPGIELLPQRDMAIHIFVDIQRWLVLNAADNMSVVFGLGINFFT